MLKKRETAEPKAKGEGGDGQSATFGFGKKGRAGGERWGKGKSGEGGLLRRKAYTHGAACHAGGTRQRCHEETQGREAPEYRRCHHTESRRVHAGRGGYSRRLTWRGER